MQHVWSTYLEPTDSSDDVASILAKRFTRSPENVSFMTPQPLIR